MWDERVRERAWVGREVMAVLGCKERPPHRQSLHGREERGDASLCNSARVAVDRVGTGACARTGVGRGKDSVGREAGVLQGGQGLAGADKVGHRAELGVALDGCPEGGCLLGMRLACSAAECMWVGHASPLLGKDSV
jgi:hypothetical protein